MSLFKKPSFAKASKGARIYMDFASATPVFSEVRRAETDAERLFANPGGLHEDALAARRALEDARERIAAQLACKARQLIFTSGLTESINLAVLGAARKFDIEGKSIAGTHWITSSIEHASVLDCFAEIERLGGDVTHIDPTEDGRIREEALQRALRPQTTFVSIGWANSEIGTIQPLRDFSHIMRAHEKLHKTKVLLHSDGGQAPLYLHPHVHTLGLDMLSLGAGKLYGPREIGVLFVNEPSVLAPVLLGGGQEKGLRSGTEKVVPAVGFAKALEMIACERDAEAGRLETLRNELAQKLLEIPGVIVNGNVKYTLPHMLNISVPGEKSGEYLALQLDRAGIALSTKSACNEGEAASHVVAALAAASEASPRPSVVSGEGGAKEAGPEWRAKNTLRFSLGRETTSRDIRRVVSELARIAAGGHKK